MKKSFLFKLGTASLIHLPIIGIVVSCSNNNDNKNSDKSIKDKYEEIATTIEEKIANQTIIIPYSTIQSNYKKAINKVLQMNKSDGGLGLTNKEIKYISYEITYTILLTKQVLTIKIIVGDDKIQVEKQVLIGILKSPQYKTQLDLDSKIYNNSTAKFLVEKDEILVPLGSNYLRFMYIESENLLVRFSLVNPHMRRAYSGDVIREYQNNNEQIIGYLKAGFNQGPPINLDPKLTNIEKTAIKRQFAKINDHNITSLESTMKFGFAYVAYVGTKYKEHGPSYTAWESIDKNDYIFSNLIGITIASDKTEMVGSKSKYQTKLDELEKLVDLLNYTGVTYDEYGVSMGRKIKQVVVDVTSTSIFTNTMTWYINYFS